MIEENSSVESESESINDKLERIQHKEHTLIIYDEVDRTI